MNIFMKSEQYINEIEKIETKLNVDIIYTNLEIISNNWEIFEKINISLKALKNSLFINYPLNKLTNSEFIILLPYIILTSLYISHNDRNIEDLNINHTYVSRLELQSVLEKFLNNIFIIDNNFLYHNHNIKELSYQLIDNLSYHKILQQITINRNIYYNYELNDTNMIWDIYYSPLKIINNYTYGNHWLFLYPLFKKSIQNDFDTKIGEKSISAIIKLLNTPFYIDLNKFKKKLNDIYGDIKKYNEDYLNNLKSLRLAYDNGLSDETIIKYQKKLSDSYKKKRLCTLLEICKKRGNKLYINILIDSRTRMYINGLFSPTNDKEIRDCIYIDDDDIDITKNKNNEIIYKIAYNKICNRFNLLDKTKISKISWLLLSLGSTIAKKEEISIEEFIDSGINIYDNFMNNTIEKNDNYYKIELYSTYIKSIVENIKVKNYLIPKDATASGLQIISFICGVSDKNMVKKFNLTDNKKWYDPYSLIIKSFLKNATKYNKKLWDRKYLKKFIMNINYGAKFSTLISYVEEEFGEKINNDDLNELKNFYIYLYDQKKYLKIPLKDYIDINNYNKEGIINLDDTKVNFTKYKFKIKKQIQLKKLYNKNYNITDNKRRTYTIKILDKKHIDKIRTNNAIRPNLIHWCDSYIIRKGLQNNNIIYIPIHDCALVPLNMIPYFISGIQDGFNTLPLKFNYEKNKVKSILCVL